MYSVYNFDLTILLFVAWNFLMNSQILNTLVKMKSLNFSVL